MDLHGNYHNSRQNLLEFEKTRVVLDNSCYFGRSSHSFCHFLPYSHDQGFYSLGSSAGSYFGFWHHVWMYQICREGDEED